MMDTRSGANLELEVYPRDPRMGKAFAIASGARMSEDELRPIVEHRSTVYLTGRNCSPDGARQMMEAATHLLAAGGAGVKVESAGLAHPPDRWRYHTRSSSILSVYRSFVTLVGGSADDSHFSCGMHNLGLPDVSIEGSVPVSEAAAILTAFNHWNLIERPTLEDGAWFACGEGEQVFSASHREFGYDADDPLNNPFGRWHLEPTDERPMEPFGRPDAEPLFMAIDRDAPELVAATERARASVGYFLAHFRSQHEYGRYMVKVRVTDGPESALFWTTLEDIDCGAFKLRLLEMPAELPSYKAGQAITATLDDLQDWAIIKNGTLVGGFSMRLQREHLPEEKRRAYDLYTGTLSYAPLDELPR